MTVVLNDLTPPTEAEESRSLDRSMSMLEITALGVGAMIGAGVFVLTGMAAGEAGPAMLLAFALNGAIALIVGACYAELATMMPRAGGAYVWARSGIGPFFGFYAGWLSAFAQTVACSLYAAAFGSFATRLVTVVTGRELPFPAAQAITVGLLLFLLGINYRGASQTGRLEIMMTGAKIAILLVVVAFGLRTIFGGGGGDSAYTPFLPLGVGGVLGAMGITFVAFEGYEIIVQSGEEVRRPDRTIPRAIFLSIAIAVVIYLLVAVVMLGAVEAPEGETAYGYLGRLEELGLMRAAGQFVPQGEILLLIAGMVSTASALTATIFGSSRIVFAMGRQGDLPAFLGRVHAGRRTPHGALAATGALMVILAVGLPIKDIAAGTNIMFLLVFVLVCVVVIRLRSRRPDRERPFRVPLSPLLPGLGILAGLVLSVWLFDISLAAWLVALCWLALGGGLYAYRRNRDAGAAGSQE